MYVKQVEYVRIQDINFTSARKMKSDLDATNHSLPNVSSPENSTNRNVAEKILAPTKPEMEAFYAELSKSSNKSIALSLVYLSMQTATSSKAVCAYRL